MVKIKNVRPGILIVADAGLKLAPGESVELDALTPQARKAVDDGLLACTDKAPAAKPEPKPETKAESKPAATADSKPKGKAADNADGKEPAKKGKGQQAEEEQAQAPEENTEPKPEEQPKETGQGQLLGTDDAPK